MKNDTDEQPEALFWRWFLLRWPLALLFGLLWHVVVWGLYYAWTV